MKFPRKITPWIFGCTALFSSALLANVPQQRRFTVPASTLAQGLDTPIGKAWFSVKESSGTKMRVVPLMPLELLLTRTAGTDNPPNGLLQCLVVQRAIVFSDKALTDKTPLMITVAVLQCPGGREYAVETPIFYTDKGEKTEARAKRVVESEQ